MKIINVFDAVKEGDFEEFQRLYTGNINEINEFSKFNLLQTTFINTYNEAGRLKIIDYLIKNGINVNYQDKKNKRNALHICFFDFLDGNLIYLKMQLNY